MRALRHPGRLGLLALCLAVLAMRLLIPAGYMPASDGRIAITPCPDRGDGRPVVTGMDHHHAATPHPDQHDDRAPHDAPVCAYAGLAAPALGAFVAGVMILLPRPVAIELLAIPPPRLWRQAPYLRPPLRAPPTPIPVQP